MNRRVGWMDGWMDEQTRGFVDRWTDVEMDGSISRWMHGENRNG